MTSILLSHGKANISLQNNGVLSFNFGFSWNELCPSTFAINFHEKLFVQIKGHVSCHEKTKLNDNNIILFDGKYCLLLVRAANMTSILLSHDKANLITKLWGNILLMVNTVFY